MASKETSIDALIEKAAAGKLSRRQFGQLLSATGVSLIVAPMLSRPSAAAGEEAFYFTWGGYDIPELFGEYQEKHGALPDMAPYGSSNEGFTKVQAGFVVDVMHPCNTNIDVWIESGALQPLDTSRLAHWGDVIPSLKKLGEAGGEHYFAAFDWGQTSVTYRTDLVDFPDGEESWSVLWDERYKGRVAMIGNEGDSWWCAAIYAGVPFEEIESEASIEKVATLLREQQPMVRMYTDDMTTVEQALASGELVAAMTWNSSPVALKAQGVPVAFAAPKEGALTWVCGAVIMGNAPHVDKAYDVIDSLLSPESGRFLINDYGYGHSNQKAFDLVGDERLAELGLSRNPEEILSAGKYQIPVSGEFMETIANVFAEVKGGF
jgi:spermidine/putrescine transport system substrate-binding protein